MAKKPGPVAGSLGNTDYYYKSDGTVVDENGIPASARISAMFAAPPPVEEAAAVVAPKRKKKNNAQIAGVLKNTKYYYAPDGSIIDDQSKPAPDKIAAYFPPHEKREAIAAAMPKAPGIKAATKATGVPSKVIKQFNKNISIATNLITTNQKIMESYPKLFEQMSGVVQKMTEQNETVIRTMIQNNQEFQDKVIETLTGVKAPTQAGGSVAPKPGRKGAGRKSLKASRAAAVTSRAKGIKQAKGGMSTGAAIGLAVAGAAAVGVGAALINNAGNVPISDYNGPGVSATGSAREAITFFESKGWTKAQAIGIAANLEAESKFKTSIVGDGGKAYGIAQWHPDRQRKFQEIYRKNIRESNFQEQLEFVNWELNNSHKGAGNLLRQTTDAAQAARIVDAKYEISLAGMRGDSTVRMNIALKYAKGEGLTVAPTTPTAPAAPGAPTTTAPAPAAATTGAPERRPSATPEEAAQHTANVNELKNINDLAKRKGPGSSLGQANAARKAELEQKIQAFQQRISIAPMQQAGTVRPLDTTGTPSQQQVQTSLASLGNGSSTIPGMVKLKTPGGIEYTVAAQYASNFKGFVDELEKSGYKIKSIGGYANRNIAGTNTKSYHSLGAAIDINPSANPHLKDGRLQTDMPPNVGAMAAKYGLGWGGNWRSSKDAMHFSMGAGEGGSASIDRSGTSPVPGAPAPDYYAPGGNAGQVASMSQSYAMDRNAAACACPPTIINNTMINDNIRTIMQPSISQITRHNFGTPFNQSAFAAGAAIGGLLRRLF